MTLTSGSGDESLLEQGEVVLRNPSSRRSDVTSMMSKRSSRPHSAASVDSEMFSGLPVADAASDVESSSPPASPLPPPSPLAASMSSSSSSPMPPPPSASPLSATSASSPSGVASHLSASRAASPTASSPSPPSSPLARLVSSDAETQSQSHADSSDRDTLSNGPPSPTVVKGRQPSARQNRAQHSPNGERRQSRRLSGFFHFGGHSGGSGDGGGSGGDAGSGTESGHDIGPPRAGSSASHHNKVETHGKRRASFFRRGTSGASPGASPATGRASIKSTTADKGDDRQTLDASPPNDLSHPHTVSCLCFIIVQFFCFLFAFVVTRNHA